MRILSFDIGICNLAYALIECNKDDNTITIQEWDVVDVTEYTGQSKHLDDLSLGLLQALSERFQDSEINVVVLENQPVQKNPTMKSVQIVIYTYFQLLKLQSGLIGSVRLMSAINKTKWVPQVQVFRDTIQLDKYTCSSAYQKNKKLSVDMAGHLLTLSHVRATDSLRNHFTKHKKKDDLSDALLQAYKAAMDVKALDLTRVC